MIAVDTSALLAIVLNEPEADRCIAALEADASVIISAGTLAEALIVAGRRNVAEELTTLIDRLGLEVISLTQAGAKRIGDVYARWGKGIHPAGLNLGDCFAYDVAKEHACALLFVGADFSKTDLRTLP